MNSAATVACAILDELAAAGVEVVFGLPGVHNLPMWSDHQPHHPKIVGVRHEQAAVYAADGYARATGRLGVAITTTGPGAANAMGAFGEAAVSGSPILLISSDVSQALRSSGPGEAGQPRGILHEMNDQAAMFKVFDAHGVVATNAHTPAEVIAAVRAAIAAAQTTPTSPHYVGVPADVLGLPAEAAAALPELTEQVIAPESHVRLLAQLINASPKTVIWAGGGVVQCGAAGEEAVAALAQRLSAPVVTTYAGRGLLANDPRIMTTPVHEPEIAELIAEADLLLIIGSDADGMNTRNWQMPLPPKVAAIGLGASLERTFACDALVAADLVDTINRCLELVQVDAGEWAYVGIDDAVRARLRLDERTAKPTAFVEAVEQWPSDGVVVCDMAVAGYWVGGYARQPRPRRIQYPVGWGTLGYALPAAIGPASIGIPTLAVCGDGGPMFALGELATIAQHQLPVTLLIVDDGGYGMLRFDQQVFGHPERGVDLFTPDWAKLAESMGFAFIKVADAEALARELSSPPAGPRLVLMSDRFFPPRTTSPRWNEDPA